MAFSVVQGCLRPLGEDALPVATAISPTEHHRAGHENTSSPGEFLSKSEDGGDDADGDVLRFDGAGG